MVGWPSAMRESGCRLRRSVAFGVLLAVTAQVARAAPDEDPLRAEARSLAYAGVEAYAVKDYATASAKLEQAFGRLQIPSLGLWSARALLKLGKWVEAEARYRAVAAMHVRPSDPPVQVTSQIDAATELGELLPKLPTITLHLDGATTGEVLVTLDGVLLGTNDVGRAMWINPGRAHTVVARRGAESTDLVVSVGEGGHEELWLRLPPQVALAPAPHGGTAGGRAETTRLALRTSGWIALTAGATGLATSLVAYVIARDKYRDFEKRDLCVTEQACSPAERDAYSTWSSLSLVGFVSGSVLALTGAGLLITTQPSSAALAAKGLTLQLGVGSASVRGSF